MHHDFVLKHRMFLYLNGLGISRIVQLTPAFFCPFSAMQNLSVT